MRRPLSVIGFTLITALSVLSLLGNTTLALFFALISYVLLAFTLLIKKTRRNLILPTVFAAIVAACLLFYTAQSEYVKVSSLSGRQADIVATVAAEPMFNGQYGRYYCEAEIESINGKKYNSHIRLSFGTGYEDIDIRDFTIGNTLSFHGRLYTVGSGIEDIVNYFKSEKIYIGVHSIENLTVTDRGTKPVAYYGNELRQKISESLHGYFDKDVAGLLTALLTGDKQYVSDGIYDSFKSSGVAHLLAVSGMHLTILTVFIGNLIKILIGLRKGKRIKKNGGKMQNLFLMLFVFFVMFLAGFSGSVVRAGIMMLMLLFGGMISRKADSLNSLGLACIIVLTANPFACMDTGFLLSLLSTLSILTASLPITRRLSPKINDRLGVTSNKVATVIDAVVFCILTSLCIMVYTLPIMVSAFGYVSLISPVANLLFLPVTTLIIQLAAVAAVLCGFGIMPKLLVKITSIVCTYCINVAELLGGTDRFIVELEGDRAEVLCLIFTLTVIFLCRFLYYLIKRHRRRIVY